MENDSAPRKRIHDLSDEELLQMIKSASEYRPEAISYAQEELSRRGGLDGISERVSLSQQHEEERRREEHTTKPLFLHIPISRLIAISIISFGLYEFYWIYKNWSYIKERHNLYITPLGRAWLGIFYCHSLLCHIHEDKDARSIQAPSFSPGDLATGWVVLWVTSALIGHALGIAVSIISAFVPSFLCLVPVQKYANAVNERHLPGLPYYRWSFGHVVCLVFGIIGWAIHLIILAGW